MVDLEVLENQLEQELPGLEVEVYGDGDIDIISKLLEGSPLELKSGKKMPEKIAVKPENIEQAKEDFKDQYYSRFIQDSIQEAGGEIPEKHLEKPEVDQPREDEIVKIAKQTTLSTDQRISEIGEIIEPQLLEDYGEVYSNMIVDLEIPPKKPKNVKITLGGELKDDTPSWFIRFPAVYILKTGVAPVEKWEDQYENLINLTKLLDTRKEFFPEVEAKLNNLSGLSSYDIRKGKIPDEIFFSDEEVGKLVNLSVDFWAGTILRYMEDVSPALKAAQEVYLCDLGNESICRQIQDRLAARPKVGYYKWYLQEAFERMGEGKFEPRRFLKLYNNVARAGGSEEEAREELEARKEEFGIESSSPPEPSERKSSESESEEKTKNNYRDEIMDRM